MHFLAAVCAVYLFCFFLAWEHICAILFTGLCQCPVLTLVSVFKFRTGTEEKQKSVTLERTCKEPTLEEVATVNNSRR